MTELSEHGRHHRPSLFGPIVLITIGLGFLLVNLNLVSDLHWWAAIALWPLLLIAGGLNILALQAPRPYATLLSGGIALLTVAVFAYTLLFGLSGLGLGRLQRLGGQWQTKEIQFVADDVQTAVVDIHIGPPGARLDALEDSHNLIEGYATYRGKLIVETSRSGSRATVRVEPGQTEWRFFNSIPWVDVGELEPWELGLNPDIITALSLEANAGSSTLDLRGLELSDLTVVAGASEVTLFLPDGSYDANLAVNAGSAEITVPRGGQHNIELEVNAGSATLYLPPGMEARVRADAALGDFNTGNSGLRRVSSDEDGGVWETAGYAGARDRINVNVDVSVGSVTIRRSEVD